MDEIAKRLRFLRGDRSQQQFGELTGLPQRKLSRLETGITPLDVESTHKICKTLKISADWLLFGRGSVEAKDEDMAVGEEARPALNRLTSQEAAQWASLEKERRELSNENRQLYREKAELLKEIANLRERVARLEEQAKNSNYDLKQGFTNPTASTSAQPAHSGSHSSDHNG